MKYPGVWYLIALTRDVDNWQVFILSQRSVSATLVHETRENFQFSSSFHCAKGRQEPHTLFSSWRCYSFRLYLSSHTQFNSVTPCHGISYLVTVRTFAKDDVKTLSAGGKSLQPLQHKQDRFSSQLFCAKLENTLWPGVSQTPPSEAGSSPQGAHVLGRQAQAQWWLQLSLKDFPSSEGSVGNAHFSRMGELMSKVCPVSCCTSYRQAWWKGCPQRGSSHTWSGAAPSSR